MIFESNSCLCTGPPKNHTICLRVLSRCILNSNKPCSSLPISFTSFRSVVISGFYSSSQKRRHFIFSCCFCTKGLGRPLSIGTRGELRKAHLEQNELCQDLPAGQRFAAVPFLQSCIAYSKGPASAECGMSRPMGL